MIQYFFWLQMDVLHNLNNWTILSNEKKIELTNLKVLVLFNKQLTELPDSIGNLTNLKRLSLFYNKLTEFPDTISNLTNFTILSLGANQLTKLPDTIGNLTKLIELYLGNNELTELPDTIGNLTKLIGLDLSNNELTELPNLIGTLTKLIWLDLNNNQLTELPDTIGNLINLKRLDLMELHFGKSDKKNCFIGDIYQQETENIKKYLSICHNIKEFVKKEKIYLGGNLLVASHQSRWKKYKGESISIISKNIV